MKTAKPQSRQKKVREHRAGQGGAEVSEPVLLKLESACKSPGNLVECRFYFSWCGVRPTGVCAATSSQVLPVLPTGGPGAVL